MTMRQLVTRNATPLQTVAFFNSFAVTNYFATCETQIIPEAQSALFTIKVTPREGNHSVAVYMHDGFINPESGYIDGELVFTIEEVAEK